jgi:glycine betaine catabolism A
MDHLKAMLKRRKVGHSLEGDFYHSQAVLDIEYKAIFEKEWVFVGNSSEISNPGDYITAMVGRNSVILLRKKNGEIGAYLNSCRHRGSLICLEKKGHSNRLVCPYHQWTYDENGALIHAGEMPSTFDPVKHSLKTVNLQNMSGMLYVCVSDNPPDFENFKSQVEPYIGPHQPYRCKIAHEESIVEEANWKLVVENNRECYHCASSHPELTFSLTAFAMPDDPRADDFFTELMPKMVEKWEKLDLPHKPVLGGDKFRCIRLPFINNALSMTMDGSLACRKLLGDLEEKNLGSARMFHVPGNWNHFCSDYILHANVTPLSPERTQLTTKWLVHEDAIEGWDYDIEHLTRVWQTTNEQDCTLASNNHLGTQSIGYEPGTYAESEFMLTDFTNWYAAMMEKYLSEEV